MANKTTSRNTEQGLVTRPVALIGICEKFGTSISHHASAPTLVSFFVVGSPASSACMVVAWSSSSLDSHAHVHRHPVRQLFRDLEINLNMLDHLSQVLPPNFQYYALGAAIAFIACASAYALTAPRQPPKFPAPQLYDETGPIDLIALDKTIKEGFQNVSANLPCCESCINTLHSTRVNTSPWRRPMARPSSCRLSSWKN